MKIMKVFYIKKFLYSKIYVVDDDSNVSRDCGNSPGNIGKIGNLPRPD